EAPFLGVGLVVLARAFSAFAVVLRRSTPKTLASEPAQPPPLLRPATDPAQTTSLAEATEAGAVSAAASERDADQLRERAQADADQRRTLSHFFAEQLR